MPAKVFMTKKTFNSFERTIKNMGYVKYTNLELDTEAISNEFRPPRKPKNRYNLRSEKYRYEHRNYTVKLQPSYVKRLEFTGMNEEDSGWLRFIGPNNQTLHVEKFSRTEHMLRNMQYLAKGFAEALERIPICKNPVCRHRLTIVPPAAKDAYWDFPYLVCPSPLKHDKEKPISILTLITDYHAHTEIKNRMNKRRWYEKKLALIGKKPGTAKARRKKWKKNPPPQF